MIECIIGAKNLLLVTYKTDVKKRSIYSTGLKKLETVLILAEIDTIFSL